MFRPPLASAPLWQVMQYVSRKGRMVVLKCVSNSVCVTSGGRAAASLVRETPAPAPPAYAQSRPPAATSSAAADNVIRTRLRRAVRRLTCIKASLRSGLEKLTRQVSDLQNLGVSMMTFEDT